jgi:hypothetical protein
MIAHVAEAGEGRGRVVIRLGAYAPSSPAALSAAVHVARAFQSKIEGLFIEDPEVFAAAARPFVRALSLTGEVRYDLTPNAIDFDTSHFAVAVQRELAEVAKAGRVAFSARVVRDDVIDALSRACSEHGPWNIIVFAEPVVDDDISGLVSSAIQTVWGTTGTIVAGRASRWRRGPIVLALEDTDRLTGMLRAARRLAAVAGEPIGIQLVAADDIALDWLESEIRLTLGDAADIEILPRPAQIGSDPVWLATIAGHLPRIVLARHGGQLMPAGRMSGPLANLVCPVFLVH